MKSTEEEARREASRHRAANDSDVKMKDAGGFAQGSKAKIVTENAGTQYESFTVEYGGNPLKRGFKSREAAVKYAKNQGLTVDEKTIDKAIRNCDDLKSDKEKALEEYKEAKSDYERVAAKAKNLEEMKALGNTPEFKKFVEKKRVCMQLGCRI